MYDENKYLTRQAQIMTGAIDKQNQQTKVLDNGNIQLVGKGMENNLLNGVLKETDDKDCQHTVQKSSLWHPRYHYLDNGIYEACRMDA